MAKPQMTLEDLNPKAFPKVRRQKKAPAPESAPAVPTWMPVPVTSNVIFAGQRSHEQQRAGYHPAGIKHPGKMLPDEAAILLATYVAPMAETLGRRPVVLDGMAGIGTTLVEGIRQGMYMVGVELERNWAGVSAENCRICERQYPGRGAVICGDARDLPELLRRAADAGLLSPPYGQTPDGKDAWGWKAYQQQTAAGADGAVTSPPFGASRLSQIPKDPTWWRERRPGGDGPRGYVAPPAADGAVTSPPYGDNLNQGGGPDHHPDRFTGGQQTAAALREGYDGGLVSPPYADSMNQHPSHTDREARRQRVEAAGAMKSNTLGGPNSIMTIPQVYDGGCLSPPYGPAQTGGGIAVKGWHDDPTFVNRLYTPDNHTPEAPDARASWGAYRAGQGPSPGWAGIEERRNSPENSSPQADGGLVSPPYGPVLGEGDHGRGTDKAVNGIQWTDPGRAGANAAQHGAGYAPQADGGVVSPPYGGIRDDGGQHQFGDSGAMANYSGEERVKSKRQRKQDNLGNVPYGSLSSALEYMAHLRAGGVQLKTGGPDHDEAKRRGWANYLAQMAPVYLGYHQVIRAGGVLIVVVKNFRRERGEVNLSGDTIALCEAAEFKLHAVVNCIMSKVELDATGQPRVVPRVAPFKRVNANRRQQEEGIPQLLEVYEQALVFKRLEDPRPKKGGGSRAGGGAGLE